MIIRLSAVLLFVFVTALAAAPRVAAPSSVQNDPLVPTGDVNRIVKFGQYFHTSEVVHVRYQFGSEYAKVIFGPIKGADSAYGGIDEEGNFYVEEGFAYMLYPEDTTKTGLTTRPYIRTKRVDAVGEGSTWAVEVTESLDRLYFVQGTLMKCEKVDSDKYKHFNNHRHFTRIPGVNPNDTTDPFSPPSPYMDDTTARAFARYVDGFEPLYHMPKMVPAP